MVLAHMLNPVDENRLRSVLIALLFLPQIKTTYLFQSLIVDKACRIFGHFELTLLNLLPKLPMDSKMVSIRQTRQASAARGICSRPKEMGE
jgi:hypothetical protein